MRIELANILELGLTPDASLAAAHLQGETIHLVLRPDAKEAFPDAERWRQVSHRITLEQTDGTVIRILKDREGLEGGDKVEVQDTPKSLETARAGILASLSANYDCSGPEAGSWQDALLSSLVKGGFLPDDAAVIYARTIDAHLSAMNALSNFSEE